MIEVKDLTKSYAGVRAIDHLSFSVAKGEVVGFLGPNGAGKTTTMRIMTGFMAPTSGEARVAGFDVFESPLEVKKRIGYLPETPPLYGEMSVESYLRFVARLKGVPSKSVRSAVDEALQKTNLGDVRKRVIQNLSKGFRQRVGISQALVGNPEVLILDEPTVGLDPKQNADVRELIRSLRGHHTVILSTHILQEVEASCQRVIIINGGRIVKQGALDRLNSERGRKRVHIKLAQPTLQTKAALEALEGVHSVQSLADGVLSVEASDDPGVVPRLASGVVQSGAGLLEIWDDSSDLEGVFIRATVGEKSSEEVSR
jgi:ABC-2 type transport system ATP-binding protein